MNRQNPDEDLLDQAVRRIQDVPAFGAVPTQRLLKSLAASRDAATRQPHWIFERIRAMKPLSKIAASVLLALGLVAAGWAVLNARTALAFAAVAEQLHESKTLTADLVLQQPQITMRWKILYLAPGHVRFDLGGGKFQVFDQSTGKIVLLDESQKLATIINVVQQDQNARTAIASIDWIERLRNFGPDSGKPAGETDVNGVHAKKFLVQANGQEYTIFADAKTGTPLRVEFSTQLGDNPVAMTLDNIALGLPLDSALFSTEVPAGYKQQQANMSGAPIGEADLVKFLEVYAEHTEVFPPSLRDFRKDTGIGAGTLPKGSNAMTPEFLEAVNQTTRAMLFLNQLPASANWRYAGTGVKKGNAAKPIFWYRPGDAKTYRVIFADLHIADVPAADVPVVSTAETQPSK